MSRLLGILLCAVVLALCDITEDSAILPLLKNERIYRRLIDCLLEVSNCPPDFRRIKDKVESVVSGEGEITDAMRQAIIWISQKNPADLKLLQQKFGKEGQFMRKFLLTMNHQTPQP